MELHLAQTISKLAEDCEFEVKLHKEYVGRCMSKPTAAVSGISTVDILRLIINCADEFVDEDGVPIYFVGGLRQDNFGLSTIIY